VRHAFLPFLVLALAACGGSHAVPSANSDGGDAAADASDGAIVPLPRAPSRSALRDVVGLSTHTRLGTDGPSVNERAFEWARLQKLGVHRIRTDLTWSTIEPTRGALDFSAYDPLVAEATSHGVDVLAILDYGAPWATSAPGADEYFPPDNPADFAAYAEAVAQHFHGPLNDYEVWNEENNGLSFWHGGNFDGDPVKYGALLAATTTSLLAMQSSANVAFGGTVYDYYPPGPDFLAQAYASSDGLAAKVPVCAMHAYERLDSTAGPEDTSETPLVDKVATMSGALAASGAPNVPIWITEIGWPATDDPTARQQARYDVRAVILGALAGADRVYVYTLEEGPSGTDDFGITDYADWDAGADAASPADKPAFVALEALLGAVGDFAVSARLPAPPSDVFLVELAKAGNKAWIAWRATEGVPAAPVEVPASGNVRITQVDGGTLDDIADGGYVVQVGPDPVIVAPR
jgi:hypothetical protein